MKNILYILLSALLTLTSCQQSSRRNVESISKGELNVIPKPQSIKMGQGQFTLNRNTRFYVQDESQQKIAAYFSNKVKKSSGFTLEVKQGKPKNNAIILQVDESLDLEEGGYTLEVSKEQIQIKANTSNGLFNGMQTLMQLLPSAIESQTLVEQTEWAIPSLEITDEPAFQWRGLNLDVSRHFIPVDSIKKQLDVLAIYKINKFHWHLTDDQGWRVEIKKYPKLTEISSQRKNDDGSTYDGYYSHEDIKQVVSYAAERFIDVIPEIDVPGHVVAVLAAYPELSCTEGHFETRTLWGVDANILCAGKEHTFTFLEDVFAEIVPLFPFEYIHIGGDEVPKDKWEKCPHCQKRIKEENLDNEAHLQSYFMARTEGILKAHNKKIFGWDEILEGGLSATANVTSWTGEKGGIAAANAGHDVVMNPAQYTYLNFYQGDHKVEPMAFGEYISLQDIYQYDPIPQEITPEKRKHILGSQASIWTEYIYNTPSVEYQLYPRVLAMAELTWTEKENKSYHDFLNRLNNQYVRLDKRNINYHIPIPEGPSSDKIVFTDSISLAFNTTRPARMFYTTDGTMPTINSKLYTKPLTFDKNTSLKIVCILSHGKTGIVRELDIVKEKMVQAIHPSSNRAGLLVKTIKGHFKNVSEVDFSARNYKISHIDSLEAANQPYDWGHYVNEDNFRALSIEGYINIAEDGIYNFSSRQDQLWIADKLIIDSENPIKKHPVDATIALSKGKHKLKIIYLNNIVKGWATDWNTVELHYKKFNDNKFKPVQKEMLSY